MMYLLEQVSQSNSTLHWPYWYLGFSLLGEDGGVPPSLAENILISTPPGEFSPVDFPHEISLHQRFFPTLSNNFLVITQ